MRNNRIDVMKGIAIILMVMGHSGFYFTSFIYLFHMAVFFMISGYLFRAERNADFGGLCKYIFRKIKGIWLPAFVWSTVFICANNFLINIGVYANRSEEILGNQVDAHAYMSVSETVREIIKALFMVGRTELGGAFWFFTTLFGVAIFCAIVDFVLSKFIKNEKRKDVAHGFFSIVLCLLGWSFDFLNISQLTVPVIFSCYILYFGGYMIKKYVAPKLTHPLWVILAFAILVVLYMMGVRYNIGLNRYVNPICLLLTSFSGWILLSWLAEVIENKKIASVIKIIGQNTLPIVIHHFWCLKLVHLVQIWIYKYPRRYLAAFPYLNGGGLWWICYTVVGVALPVLLHMGIKKIIHRGKESF